MKYQRAKVKWHSEYRYIVNYHYDEWHDTPDHDIPQTVIDALKVFPNMPVCIGGYLYRVIS